MKKRRSLLVFMENTISTADRSSIITCTSRTGIIVNLILVTGKGLAGLLSGSVAIETDALNNLSDAVSAIITLAGAKYASRKPDRGHPYGHGRAEYVSAAAIAVIILYTAVTAFIESVSKIIHPEETRYDTLAIVVMVSAVAVKLVLARYYREKSVQADSQALSASAVDALFDAVISSAILAGAGFTALTGLSIDGWMGAAIAVVIFRSGLGILRKGLSSILGERIPAELTKHLRAQILDVDGVEGVEDLELHTYGPDRMSGAVHIVLSENMTVGEADAICRQITADLLQDHGIEMTVGIYAANTHSQLASAMQGTLARAARHSKWVKQAHGFYLDRDSGKVSFHLVVDFDCPDAQKATENITALMTHTYPGFTFETTIDRDIAD